MILCATCWLLTSSALAQQEHQKHTKGSEPEVVGVSIIRLVAAPTLFDGKIVKVAGYVGYDWEGGFIGLSGDARGLIHFEVQAHWIRNPPCQSESYVELYGIFRLKSGYEAFDSIDVLGCKPLESLRGKAW
jgi:hypothetical protein